MTHIALISMAMLVTGMPLQVCTVILEFPLQDEWHLTCKNAKISTIWRSKIEVIVAASWLFPPHIVPHTKLHYSADCGQIYKQDSTECLIKLEQTSFQNKTSNATLFQTLSRI